MKTPLVLLTTIFVMASGCMRYPSMEKIKQENIQEDAELAEQLTLGELPADFFKAQEDKIYLKTGWYFIADSAQGVERAIYRDTLGQSCFLDTVTQLSPHDMEELCLNRSNHHERVIDLLMYFDEQGSIKWEEVTAKATGRHLGFVVNNILLTAPLVNQAIPSGVSMFCGIGYTAEEMYALKVLLQEQGGGDKTE